MTDSHAAAVTRSNAELRAAALEAELVQRGLVSTDAIDAVVEHYKSVLKFNLTDVQRRDLIEYLKSL